MSPSLQRLKQHLQVKLSPLFPLDSESIPGIKAVGAPVYPLIKAAFKLTAKRPWGDKAIKVLDKVYIIRLKKRVHANMKKFKKEQAQYVQTLLTRRRREFQEAWLNQIRATAKIYKNKNVLKLR